MCDFDYSSDCEDNGEDISGKNIFRLLLVRERPVEKKVYVRKISLKPRYFSRLDKIYNQLLAEKGASALKNLILCQYPFREILIEDIEGLLSSVKLTLQVRDGSLHVVRERRGLITSFAYLNCVVLVKDGKTTFDFDIEGISLNKNAKDEVNFNKELKVISKFLVVMLNLDIFYKDSHGKYFAEGSHSRIDNALYKELIYSTASGNLLDKNIGLL